MEWYIAIHHAPARTPNQQTWHFHDPGSQDPPMAVESLELNGADLTSPLPVTFEEVIATFQSWDCMLIEPDGSIVWANPDWRIDVQLQDGRDGLHYVEVRTTAPRAENERLLSAFGVEPLVVQLIQEGVFLESATWLSLLKPVPPN